MNCRTFIWSNGPLWYFNEEFHNRSGFQQLTQPQKYTIRRYVVGNRLVQLCVGYQVYG